MVLDGFGREIDYLRISLTDRCNLRCTYCMPLEADTFLAEPGLLTASEIATVVRAAVSLGFRKFRLTGGEPTLRPDLVEIVGRIARTPGVADLALTTNGTLLDRLAAPLAEAGLRRVNVHLDSLDARRLARTMRSARLDRILDGIAAAEAAGLGPMKLNSVVDRDENEADVVPLAALTLERPWHVRFVELMPVGDGECARFARERFVSNAVTLSRIDEALGPLEPVPGALSDEARCYRLERAAGIVGFISPVTEPYCGSCNRMRLTADGRLRLCLLGDAEVDLRDVLRRGGGADAVRERLLEGARRKPAGHRLAEGQGVRGRAMHAIGG
jgi:cyclic pyranopterin phosphate synthase